MKRLPDVLHIGGFKLTLLDRMLDVAIYEKTKHGFKFVSYEVVLIKWQPERTLPNGLSFQMLELYPSSERWGQLGWSYRDKEDALAKFYSLCKRRIRQHEKAPAKGNRRAT